MIQEVLSDSKSPSLFIIRQQDNYYFFGSHSVSLLHPTALIHTIFMKTALDAAAY
jgi:hypothetical protein